MKLKISLLLFLFACTLTGFAQEEGPSYIGNLTLTGHTPSLMSRINDLPPATVKDQQMMDGRSAKYNVIPGKGSTGDKLAENPHPLRNKIPGRAPIQVFDAAFSNSQPTDPALAVGPNHVMVVFNTGFAIYDKSNPAQLLLGPVAPNPTIFPNGGCCDLTVSYDNAADRWVLSFLGGGAQIAVSDGPDPTTAGWYTYNVGGVQDYNKLSVWSDGYYISNQPGPNRVFALDRTAMLAGAPSPSIQGFQLPGFANFGFASPQILNVTDGNMPATGNAPIVMFQDDAYSGVTVDHIKFWNANVDFTTPANSTISAPQEIPVTAFTSIFDGASFNNLPQPNGGALLDALQGIVMNQAQFRQFPGYNSAVFNFVVDTDPTAGKMAAVRWYEFRQTTTGAPWTMFQEGTYNAPNDKHAWNASIMMDGQGNIGMGYTGMSNASGAGNINASSYYTGRFSTDPPGTMTITEEVIALGNSSIPGGAGRYGDYSKIDIDPNDDATFWFDNEYVSATGNARANVVGVFKIAPDAVDDTGVIDIVQPVDGELTATETVEVIVRNFGSDPQSNVPVTFTVDGGGLVTEIIAGPIPPASNVNYTFTATADLSSVGTTYTIQSCTVLVGDENAANDCFSKDVTHLEAADTGVIALNAPVSGSGLTATEDVTITIQNFGAAEQTSIPVFYSINGGTPVQETYTGSIPSGMTDTYTFTATADLSALGDYEFVAGTELAGDVDPSNDDFTATVSNFICQPESNCEDFNDGVILLELADQSITTECGTTPPGYSDNTDIVFNFVLNDNPFEGNLQTGFEDTTFGIWIDFNDNNEFENNELIVDGISGGTAATDTAFTVDFSTIPTTAPGMHLMRVRGGDENFGTGNTLDPCDDLEFGRTNDYTANITGEILGVNDVSFADAEFIITSQPNNQFELTFNTTEFTKDLPLYIYNTLGQNLAFYTLENNGTGYTKTIDMSYVSSGVYFVKLGNEKLNKVKRIIVK